MRTAQTALRPPMLPRPIGGRPRADRREAPRIAGAASRTLWFGAAFLAGYLPGIRLGQGGTLALGQQLAAYYAKSPGSTAFAAAFGARFSIAFLQLCAVFLCGFCVCGVGLLAVVFVARGVFLGCCAASIAAVNGVTGVVQYRLGTAISDITTLFLCLWLAGHSAKLAAELFRAIRGYPTREMPAAARRLAIRFVAAAALSAVFSAVGAFLALVIAGGGR